MTMPPTAPPFDQSPMPQQAMMPQNFNPAINPQSAIQQQMQQLAQSGATSLPPVNAGPAGQTNYALSQDIPPEDQGDELEYFDAIDRKRIKGLDDQKLTDLGQTIYNMAYQGQQQRRDGGMDDNIEHFRDMYEGIMDDSIDEPWEGACQLATPDSRTQVETVAARIREAIFSSAKYLKIRPGFPEDMEACHKCRDFAKSEAEGPNLDLPTIFYQGSQTALVDGYVIGMAGWNRRKEKKRQRVIVNDATLVKMGLVPPPYATVGTPVKIGKKTVHYGTYAIIETEDVVDNHITLDFISIKDTTMWPSASTIETSTLFGYFFGETPDEMRIKVASGYYDKEATEDVIGHSEPLGTGLDNGIDLTLFETADREEVTRSYEQGNTEFGRRKLLYCHAKIHDADGDGIMEDICFVMEWSTRKIIRAYLPDFLARPWEKLGFYPRVGGSFHDYSLIGKLFDTQQELDAITRQGINSATLSMSAIVEQEAGRRKPGDIPFTPGITFWDTVLDGAIKKVHVLPDVPSSNLVDRSDVRRMIEKIGGSDEVTQGVGADSSAGTLGQTNLAVAGGNIRLKAACGPAMQFLTWFYNRFFEYHNFYMENRRSYEVIRAGKHTYPSITLDDLAVTQYATVQAYSSNLDPQAALRAQKVQVVFQAFANSPFVQNNFERQGKLLTFLAEAMDLDDDMSEFIGTPEEWRQMDQQYAETMQQQSMQAQQDAALANANGQPSQGPPQGSNKQLPKDRGSNPASKRTSMGPAGLGPQSIPLGGGPPR